MLVDELKKLRDEMRGALDAGLDAVFQVPVRTPEQIAILDTLIKLFEGDSAESDVLGRLVEAWRGSSNPYLHEKSIAAATSGALAIRALPKVMAEVERLRGELKCYEDFTRKIKAVLEKTPEPNDCYVDIAECAMEAYRNVIAWEKAERAALNEGAKNER